MNTAKLRFSYGTMNSGKSLRLLTTAYDFEQRGIYTIVIKPNIDTRDGDQIKSRIGDGISRDCALFKSTDNLVKFIVCGPLSELDKKIKSGQINTNENDQVNVWIFVDEAQFMTEEQVNQLGVIVDDLGINVWCFGLRTDFKTHLFPGSKRLFEIADKIEELKSTCQCGAKNIFNARLTKDGKIAIAGAQVEVGAEDKYVSMCRKCYNEKTSENKGQE